MAGLLREDTMGYPPAPPPQHPGQPIDERMWGSAAHWSALVASVVGLAFLGPLIIMLTLGNQSPWVRRQAVESLNFQLSCLIYSVVGTAAAFVLAIVTLGIGLLVIIPAFLAAAVAWLVFTVLGAVRAGSGIAYRYPLTLRLVS
jgi:uncharacterized Tic20 family protein